MRRRRLVALAAAGVVVILAVAMILNHRSGDAFAGTWRGPTRAVSWSPT